MFRTFQIALFSATLMVTACKKTDQPAASGAEPVTKATTPNKPADPSQPAAPAAKPADSVALPVAGNNELENKSIAMMYRMADIVVADAQDCEKLATNMKAFIRQNKPLLDQLAAMNEQQTEQERAAFETRNRAVQAEVLKKVTPGMTACGENKNVQAAMQELSSE